MAKRTAFLLAGVVALAATTVLLLLSHQDLQPLEPSYKGRMLSQWVDTLLSFSSRPQDVPEAQDAIRHIGTNALPCLIKWLSYEQPGFLSRIARKNHLLRTAYSRTPFAKRATRAAALPTAGFMVLGADAAPAIPELIQISTDKRHRVAAAHATLALHYLIMGAALDRNRIGSSNFLYYAHVHTNATVRSMAADVSHHYPPPSQ